MKFTTYTQVLLGTILVDEKYQYQITVNFCGTFTNIRQAPVTHSRYLSRFNTGLVPTKCSPAQPPLLRFSYLMSVQHTTITVSNDHTAYPSSFTDIYATHIFRSVEKSLTYCYINLCHIT